MIAAMLASSRGESIGMAIVLTLFLGWIGLAIVYFGQRKRRDAVEGLMDRASGPERTRSRSSSEPPASSPQRSRVPEDAPAAVRLRELERLHRDELLTDDVVPATTTTDTRTDLIFPIASPEACTI